MSDVVPALPQPATANSFHIVGFLSRKLALQETGIGAPGTQSSSCSTLLSTFIPWARSSMVCAATVCFVHQK